jgi:hypothetical protein
MLNCKGEEIMELCLSIGDLEILVIQIRSFLYISLFEYNGLKRQWNGLYFRINFKKEKK